MKPMVQMKKLLALLLTLTMAVSLAACGKDDPATSDGDSPGAQQTAPSPSQQEPAGTPTPDDASSGQEQGGSFIGGGTMTGGQPADDGPPTWPVNEYTNLIPTPEVTVYDEEPMDNQYFVGHTIETVGWSIEDCKAYVEQLKADGFTTPSGGYDDVVIEDTDTRYIFAAENSDGVYVSIYTSNANEVAESNYGEISIQVSKRSY